MTPLHRSLQYLLLFLLCFQLSLAQSSSSPSVAQSSPPSSAPSNEPSATSSPNSHQTSRTSRNTFDTSITHRPTSASNPHTTASLHIQSPTPSFTPHGETKPTNQTLHDIELLPIQPEITPAFALAGVILIITGLAYTLVGVRKRWLSIFLSSGYLVALAVVVLVLYVANPPVSDAIQGAYFVAAFISGCIIGGLSLIFTEVTEGLGCLLGGFCLAMWFLVLKPGGLVTSLGGRIGLIAGFSVATFSLAFSRYTRTYGLMFGIAFAGATVVVLGIDCFSRAGLKEFWVYIWHVNDNLFPLYTTTYPMTRGIKVEIAGIVILFLCGLLSQWKLYKILKDRKEKKARALAQDDEAREHLETNLGRRIEDTNARERALWEKQYGAFAEKGNASAAASVAGSTYPPTTDSRAQSVKDMTLSANDMHSRDVDVVEMKEFAPARADSQSSTLSRSKDWPLNDEVTLRSQRSGAFVGNNSQILDRIPENVSRSSSLRSSSHQFQRFENVSLRPSAPPPPVVVPLPFTVSEHETHSREDTESLATVGDTAIEPSFGARKSRSTSRHIRAISEGNSSDGDGESDFLVPHIEDDRASSVAATLDELTDDDEDTSLPAVSREASPTRRSVRRDTKKISLRRVGSASDLHKEPSLPDSAVSSIKAKRRLSEPPPTDLVELVFNEPDPKEPEELSNVLNLTTAPDGMGKSVVSDGRTSRTASRSGQPSAAASLSAVKSIRLPSVAAQKFRTHEWTKYLSDAEQPMPGELDPSEDGVRIERYAQEPAAPVLVQELQQTAYPSLQTAVGKRGSNPFRSASDQTAYRQSAVAQSHTQLQSQSQVNGPLMRSFSQPAVMTQSSKGFSSPLTSQPLVESPIEDMSGTGDRATLLGMREDILRKKASATDLHRIRSNGNFSNPNFFPGQVSAFSETSSIRSFAPTGRLDPDSISLSSLKQKMEEDNMPLSHRRTIIQQQLQQGSTTSMNRLSGGSGQSQAYQPAVQASWSNSSLHSMAPNQNLIYDAHLPQRGPSVDAYTRQARMASFRESLRHGLGSNATPAQAAAANEGHRFAMLTEKRQAQAAIQQREYQKQVLDSVVDQGMRNGVMLDLHKERLRQMQSQAGGAAAR